VLTIRLLGPVEVEVDGRPVTLPVKQRALLALLGLAAGRVVTVEQAIDGLYGEQVPPTARNALQVHVSGLRRALGPAGGVVRTVAAGYQLGTEDGQTEVDVMSLRALVDRASFAGPAASGLLREATDLWRGPPMADLVAVPFVAACVTTLSEEHLVAVERRIDVELAGDAVTGTVVELEQLVALHPFREGLWHRLVLALYRCERQADALAAYRRARAVLRDELGLDPGPGLQALEQAVLRRDPGLRAPVLPRPGSPPPAARPRPLAGLVGRDPELADLVDAVTAHRLVTVTGPGGVGKTRLAVEAADRLAGSVVDSVVFVDLADVGEASAVGATIARGCGLPADNPWPQLTEHLHRVRVLLILDNLEQVAEGNAARIVAVAARASSSRILVTSRVPLRVAGEIVLPLEPLPAPDAERLFALRSRAVNPGVRLDEQTIAELCRRLDQLPLAVELAAARCRSMSPAELLGDLERVLRSDSRSADEHPSDRHRSIVRSVWWSIGLLSAPARALLPGLGAFSTPFDLSALESVCATSDLNAVDELVEAGLLLRDADRFRLLETVRSVARDLLTDDPDAETVHDRHASWVTAAAERIESGGGTRAVDRVSQQMRSILEECLTAVDHLVTVDRDEQAGLLLLRSAPAWAPYRDEDELNRSLSWLTRIATLRLEPQTALQVQLHLQDRLFWLGRAEESLAVARSAYDESRAAGFDWCIARASHALAYRAMIAGQHVEARQLCREGSQAALRAGDERLSAAFENTLGCIAMEEKDFDRAARHLRAVIDFSAGRELQGVVVGLANLVDAAVVCGRPEEARRAADELWLRHPGDDPGLLATSAHICQALAAGAGGDDRRAAQCFGASLDVRLSTGYAYGLGSELIGVAAIAHSLGDDPAAAGLVRACARLRDHEPATAPDRMSIDLLERDLVEGLRHAGGLVGETAMPATLDLTDWRAVALYAAGQARRLAGIGDISGP
jgi:predicted ATPase/DNA-binding SARP family transcriptional activator